MKRADVIIQARVSSTRLPEKVLLKILDKTILEYVIERVKRAETVGHVVVATTAKKEDSRIADLADKVGVKTYRGKEEDVLDRFYQAAKLYGLRHIVRITADCPLIDPRVIDDVVRYYFDSDADYCSNTLKRTYPDGEDVEVFGFDALRRAWREANLLSEREHVTPYIKKKKDKFKLVNFRSRINLGNKRWSLDEKEDFTFIKMILESLYPAKPHFHIEDVLEFLRSNPKVEEINKHIVIDEGYLKSLKGDKVVNLERRED